MKIYPFAVLLLLALYAALYADAQPQNVTDRYIHKQHVFGNMNTQKCDSEIAKRKITHGDSNNCKPVNTFIVAEKKQIRAVCQKGGKPKGGNLYESTKPFPVVICRLKSGERHPKCVYSGGKKASTRKITVACDQGWPVHYEEDTVVVQ
ncbi:hypothetical protein NFI96_002573 [Prochilodus magdalenae]|nr:hypothetical protein NFI96_002573 [Prochilodus magdalenae]